MFRGIVLLIVIFLLKRSCSFKIRPSKIVTPTQYTNQINPNGNIYPQSGGMPGNGQQTGLPTQYGGQQTGGIPTNNQQTGIPSQGNIPYYGGQQTGGIPGGGQTGIPGYSQGINPSFGGQQAGGMPNGAQQGIPNMLSTIRLVPTNSERVTLSSEEVTTTTPLSSSTTPSSSIQPPSSDAEWITVQSGTSTSSTITLSSIEISTTNSSPSSVSDSPKITPPSSTTATETSTSTSSSTAKSTDTTTTLIIPTAGKDSNEELVPNCTCLVNNKDVASQNIMVNSDQSVTAFKQIEIFEEECENVNPQAPKPFGKLQITVVGGQDSAEKEFPHMAALGFGDASNKQWLCGGSLVSNSYVVTAAHCLSSANLGNVRYVKLGTTNLLQTSPNAQEFTVLRQIPHPEFNVQSQTLYNDLALLQLDRSVILTEYVSPICIWSSSEYGGRILEATGWGRTETAGPTSETLQKVGLEIFPQYECQQAYSTVSIQQLPYGIQEQSQICAGSKSGRQDTCQGDSGGPLQLRSNGKWYLIGVTSFGIACGTNVPGVYTRISAYKDWVHQIIRNK